MSIFSRFMDIINANINSLLDKAEDPEKTLKLMIGEMEDTLIEMKSACASKMARQSKLKRQGDELASLIERWQKRAGMALDRGLDDLAREALVEKRKATEQLNALITQEEQLNKDIADSKNNIATLEEKLNAVKIKLQGVKEKENQAEQNSKASNQNFSDEYTARKFREMEEKIDRLQAEAEMRKKPKSAEERFAQMERDEEIERELEKMRREHC